ncbi:hypothetical protein P3T36_001048 [Kitasatospora sp. MAP12-15]|uniref:hypothetical protein n=1 Tax=unclassified Kitasatospora TaxID=2633591 RepID=UPI00247693A6|nr:hypothetical protein [Kitasatospora sp. MAP12-44]MDH6114696.1 hypothetical protein [Kitasatospora sp. MAP12-44]
MTTQGESHPIPAGAEDGPGDGLGHRQVPGPSSGQALTRELSQARGRAGRAGLRSSSRRVLGFGAAVLAIGAVVFVITRPHPGDWLPGLGPSSKDADRTPPVVGNPPATSLADPNPFTADRYFPATRLIDLNGYHAKRSGARQGNDCTETLQDRTRTILQGAGCQGYLTVSFSRTDGKVQSSVTILRFADDATGQKVAAELNAQPGLLAFMQPDTTIADPSPAAGAPVKSASRVEAVHHYVTVATSRFVDGTVGAGGASTPDPQLVDATWAASYTAEAAFIWG